MPGDDDRHRMPDGPFAYVAVVDLMRVQPLARGGFQGIDMTERLISCLPQQLLARMCWHETGPAQRNVGFTRTAGN